jgi:hypothetical protein
MEEAVTFSEENKDNLSPADLCQKEGLREKCKTERK